VSLTIRKDKWLRTCAAVNGLLRQCELRVVRITISDTGVSAIGEDGTTEVGHIDTSSDFEAPAWIQSKLGGSVSVYVNLAE
jgi:hypothetical protein